MAIRRLGGVLLILLVSCAYFNTFYNAKTYFKEAEREYEKNGLSSVAQKKYRDVIKKCSKVLDRYPKSKYVDDALYLMAVAYMRLGEKQKSRRKFEELFTFFPDSKYRERALLDYASLLISIGEYDSARSVISKIDSRKSRKETALVLAELAFKEQNYDAVIRMGREFLKSDLKNEYAKKFLNLATQAALRADSLEAARAFLSALRETSLSPKDRFRINMLYLDFLYKQKAPDTALSVISNLRYPPESNEERVISLYKAKFLLLKGDSTEAKNILREILRDRKVDSIRSIAMFNLARILEEEDSLKMADSLYAKVMYSSYKPVSIKARDRDKVLKDVISLKDSTDCRSLSRLGELYLFNLERPKKALSIYQKVFNTCRGVDKERAFYALLYMYSNQKDKKHIQNLINSYPCDSISESLKKMVLDGLSIRIECQSARKGQ